MSLDELSRKWERGGATTQADAEIKQLAGQFFTKSNIETKTRLPDADAYSDIDFMIHYIGAVYGKKYADLVRVRFDRFKINVLNQTDTYIASRDEVRDILKAEKEKEKEKGMSILERLQGNY